MPQSKRREDIVRLADRTKVGNRVRTSIHYSGDVDHFVFVLWIQPGYENRAFFVRSNHCDWFPRQVWDETFIWKLDQG